MLKTEVKKQRHLRWQNSCIVLFVALALSLGAIGFNFAQTSLSAHADEADISATKMTVNLNVTGSGGVSSLDRDSYVSGNTVNLNWKGSVTGSDLYIPTEVRVNSSVRYTVSDLIKVNQVQSVNSEYLRRMSSNGNMTTFDSLKNYVTEQHTISLGEMTLATNDVQVTYTRVKPVYRLYNMITSEHLFTTNKTEYDNFWNMSTQNADAWIGEGISWLAPASGTTDTTVYRFYNAGLGSMGKSSHYYSKDANEMVTLRANGWTNDGAENAFQSGGTTAIWTCYNEALGSAHHYTSSKSEWSGLAQHGWALEEDKNGTEGVFTGLLATSWSYSTNYYKVNHVIAGNTYVEWKEGSAGQLTNGTALSYPGYSAQGFNNVSIASDNSTTLTINYVADTYRLSFDTQGGSSIDAKNITYGSKLGSLTTPTFAGYKLKGWSLDPEGTKMINNPSEYTMPAGDLTLFAQWEADNSYVVKFDKNDDSATGSMSDMSRQVGDAAQLTANGFTKQVGDATYGFKSWNTEKDGSGTSVSDKATNDLATSGGETVTLYAQWTDENLNPYWIAASKAITTGNTVDTANQANKNYTNPETSVERTSSEIKADIEILKDSSNDKYAETLARYKKYMNSDAYHLYAKIANANVDDAYFEFRIIQIGAHESTGDKTDGTKYSDGTVMTFQATHALNTPFRVNSKSTNEGGWLSSELGIALNQVNVLSQYNSGLANDVERAQKWNRVGSIDGAIDNTMTSSNDLMWIMSYSELVGSSSGNWSNKGINNEGDQYDFWKSRGVSFVGANPALKALGKLRSGASVSDSDDGWHLRSASPLNTADFLYVDSKGGANSSFTADTYSAIVPCFTFGTTTHTVTFDTDGGTNVDSQQVPVGGFAEVPTGTIRSSKEGYHLEGWYKDKTLTEKFDFATMPIDEDITLYAKFDPDTTTRYRIDVFEELAAGGYSNTRSRYIEATGTTDTTTDTKTVTPTDGFQFDKSTEVTITGDGDAVASVYHKRKGYSVTFNMSGVETLSKPSDITSQKFGSYIVANNPTATNWQFAGWYMEANYTTRFDLAGNSMPAKNLTLYAKWNSIDPDKSLYTINHYQQNADGSYPTSATEITLRQGKAGEQTEAVALTYSGFSNRDESVTQKAINSDGSTVVDIYYKRNTHKAKFVDNTESKEGRELLTYDSVLYGATIIPQGDLQGDNLNRKFVGWAPNDPNADAFDFQNSTMPDEDVIFYSKWTISKTWIAPATTKTTGNSDDTVNQANSLYQGMPTIGVIKYQDQIESDLAILKDPTNSQYEAKVAEYKKYMTEDTYHLYTTWVGQADDQDGLHAENSYLEFRIIQVGAHDGDGSALTFQGTHTIPTAYNISDSTQTKSGWVGSPLRTKMVQMGALYKQSVFNNFKAVAKQTMKGGGDKTMTTSNDDFWIASISELTGSSYFGASEGSQYDYFKQLGISDNGSVNPALVKRTRAGNVPKDVSSGSYQGSYWTRTPDQKGVSTNKTAIITDAGFMHKSQLPNLNTGVVVCFAL